MVGSQASGRAQAVTLSKAPGELGVVVDASVLDADVAALDAEAASVLDGDPPPP
ncbi:MAG TPA: hypothetical protein VGE92_11535 [Steroidobacteraceae bacterium]